MLFSCLVPEISDPSWVPSRRPDWIEESELRDAELAMAARLVAIKEAPAAHPFGVPRQTGSDAGGVLQESGGDDEGEGFDDASSADGFGGGGGGGDSGLSPPSTISDAASGEISGTGSAPAASAPAPSATDVSMTVDD